MARVSIVTAYIGQTEMTRQFLENIADKISDEDQLILVNAGCKEQVRHPRVNTYVNLEENHSFSRSMNQGIKWATGDYVLVMGNDSFPQTEDWLDKLIEAQKETGAGIMCPVANNPPWQVYKQYIITEDDNYALMSFYPAICWLIPRQVLDKVGLFDERFLIGFYEDNDYILRVRQEDLCVYVHKGVEIRHLGSATIKNFNQNKLMNENRERFHEKWKGSLG